MPLRTDRVILATATATSGNKKIGDAGATYAAQSSCPAYCAFYNGGGCYAENGSIYSAVTKRLNDDARTTGATAVDVAQAEADAIDQLDDFRTISGKPLRLHTVGDCATDEAARIVAAACARYVERGGGPVWAYTHAWRLVDRASWGAVSVLASCETPEQVELARARGYATALVVESFAADRLHDCRTASPHQPGVAASAAGPSGSRRRRVDGPTAGATDVLSGRGPVTSSTILPCPQQTRGVSCSDCRLCMNDTALRARGYSIGFEIHGTAFTIRQARAALARPSDTRRRLTLRDLIPEYLAAHPGASTHAIARDLGYAEGSVSEMRQKLEHEHAAAAA